LGRSQELAALVIVLLTLAGCGPARDTSYDVSFAQTPVPVTQRLPTPAPNPKGPTRLPTGTTLAVDPSVPAAGPAILSTAPGVPTGSTVSTAGTGSASDTATYRGQVAEADGVYVTSSSRSAHYYYSVDEKSWDRIHTENRVWFRTVDDLQRAFPDRIAYSGRTTRTPTPVHSSTP
jgi:hypothetical protein